MSKSQFRDRGYYRRYAIQAAVKQWGNNVQLVILSGNGDGERLTPYVLRDRLPTKPPRFATRPIRNKSLGSN